MAKAKNQVRVNIRENSDCYFLEGDIDRVIQDLTKIKNENKECNIIRIDIDKMHDGYDDYVTIVVNITGYRDETPVEKKARLAENKKKADAIVDREKAKEEKELKEYKRLKKKFEE